MAKKPRPKPEPLVAEGLIDAHTHLTSCAAAPADIVQRARAAGVVSQVTVGDGIEEAEAALALAQEFSDVYAACAVHPTKAHTVNAQVRERLAALVFNARCVAVGETGLDTYWIRHDPEHTADLESQLSSLEFHNDLAIRAGKPLMIHNREADAELLDALANLPEAPAVMLHCFSSPAAVAHEAIERGYYLSFSGNVTFRRNTELREVAATMPLDQLLYETDAPYMTPEPYRGARNEPTFIGHTAACIAEHRGMELPEFLAAVRANYARLYGIAL